MRIQKEDEGQAPPLQSQEVETQAPPTERKQHHCKRRMGKQHHSQNEVDKAGPSIAGEGEQHHLKEDECGTQHHPKVEGAS